MIDLSFRINGIDRIKSIFSKLIGNDPIYDAFSEASGPLLEQMRAYEAPPVASYARSYQLMNSWRSQIKRNFSNVSISITSDARSSIFVRGKKSQAWMHRGRWNTDEQIAQAHIPNLVDAISTAYSRQIN